MRSMAKQQWDELTDDKLDHSEGRCDQLAGAIQQCYGVAKEEAERQVDSWSRGL